MPSIAIVDSGPLIAAANTADPAHRVCLQALQDPSHRLLIPALCVAEAAYLLQDRHGATVESRFLRGLEGFDVRAPRSEDWPRIAELVEDYSDFPLGATDASVVVLAEQMDTDLLITLDQRHFNAVRPRHCDHFRLFPESPQ